MHQAPCGWVFELSRANGQVGIFLGSICEPVRGVTTFSLKNFKRYSLLMLTKNSETRLWARDMCHV